MASFVGRFRRRLATWLMLQAGPKGAYGAGLHYVGRGKLQEAQQAFGHAQRLWQRELGSRHSYVSLAMSKRAWCLLELDRPEEAVNLYERALQIATEVHGSGNPRTLDLARELARARSRLHR